MSGTNDSPTRTLNVFREVDGEYQRIGTISPHRDAPAFAYCSAYLSDRSARPLSLSLPLREEAFDAHATATFFDGLLPEEGMRGAFGQAAHADAADYTRMLSRLNNESVGGLVFSTDMAFPDGEQAYLPIERHELMRLGDAPLQTVVAWGMASRLSLAGAQTKVGLYRNAGSEEAAWYLPHGSAPSTTIVKVPSGFPLQTVNEAFCLGVARRCGFDVADAELVPLPNGEPLLAIARFDRALRSDAPLVSGLPRPSRRHQEDFCQAAGLPSPLKYEPTDGHYLALASRIIARASADAFGDKAMFFNRILLDYLLGNCDNHLKNHSLAWDANWTRQELAPLYDITCTTMYPTLDRSMGVSLCPIRRIDAVTGRDVREAAEQMGLAAAFGWEQYRALRDEFRSALPVVAREIAAQGFPEVEHVARFIADDSRGRCELA